MPVVLGVLVWGGIFLRDGRLCAHSAAKLACAVVGPLQSGNEERRMACSFAGVAVRP